MNKVFMSGRLSQDIEKAGSAKMPVAKMSLAVDKLGGEEKSAEFYRLTAFSGTAKTMAQYLKKGDQIFVEGHLQQGSYEKDGQKHYTTDVIVDRFEFGAKKSEGGSSKGGSGKSSSKDDGFVDLPDDEDLDW